MRSWRRGGWPRCSSPDRRGRGDTRAAPTVRAVRVSVRRYLARVIAVPFVVSLGLAAVLAPALLTALRAAAWTAPNHRGRRLPYPTGLLVGIVAPLALAGLALLELLLAGADALPAGAIEAAAYVGGVAALGLIDDLARGGERGPRGVRAHLVSTARGRPSSGAVKAVGTAALALGVVAAPGSDLASAGTAASVLSVAALTLGPHVFNLLDLRPGRSLKGLALLGAGLTLGTRDLDPLRTLAAVLGPLLVLLPLDVRERGMLGDTGASAVGAVAGLWLVLTLPPLGQAVAVGALAAIALYGEWRSITALVERNPLLRQLDSLGQCG